MISNLNAMTFSCVNRGFTSTARLKNTLTAFDHANSGTARSGPFVCRHSNHGEMVSDEY